MKIVGSHGEIQITEDGVPVRYDEIEGSKGEYSRQGIVRFDVAGYRKLTGLALPTMRTDGEGRLRRPQEEEIDILNIGFWYMDPDDFAIKYTPPDQGHLRILRDFKKQGQEFFGGPLSPEDREKLG